MNLNLFYITNRSEEKIYCGLGDHNGDGGAWKDFYTQAEELARCSELVGSSVVVQVMEVGPFSFGEEKDKMTMCAIFVEEDLDGINVKLIQHVFNDHLVEIPVQLWPENRREEMRDILKVSQKLTIQSNPEVMLVMSTLDKALFDTMSMEMQAQRDKIILKENIPEQAGMFKMKKM